jgi:hypothetical protein
MAKKQGFRDPVKVQSLGYLEWFKLTAGSHEQWRLQDYHEQSINGFGGLCRDKPLKIRSSTGVSDEIAWNVLVYPVVVKDEPAPEEKQQE